MAEPLLVLCAAPFLLLLAPLLLAPLLLVLLLLVLLLLVLLLLLLLLSLILSLPRPMRRCLLRSLRAMSLVAVRPIKRYGLIGFEVW